MKLEGVLQDLNKHMNKHQTLHSRSTSNLTSEVTTLCDKVQNLEKEKNEWVDKYTQYSRDFKDLLRKEQETAKEKQLELK